MAHPADLELLAKGVDVWNESRKVGGYSQADFEGADLKYAKLAGVDLKNADLSNANLTGADLTEAELDGAKLSDAKLTRAKLSRAKLKGAHLWGSRLDRADLRNVDLREAHCRYASLRHANLAQANLTGAQISDADLRWANLRGARGLRLDQTLIRGASFSAWAGDPWSKLRRHYTGAKAFLNFMLLLAFLIPYVTKTLLWVGVSRTEDTVREAARAVDARVVSGLREVDLTLSALEMDFALESAASEPGIRPWPRVVDRLHVLGRATKEGWVDIQQSMVARDAKRRHYRVWQLLLGLDRGLLSAAVIILLLVYNLCRGLATFLVMTLDQQAQTSGCSPAWSSYGWLRWVDRAVQTLMWVSFGSATLTLTGWLLSPVSLP